MDDFKLAVGQPLALRAGALGEFEFELDAVLGEDAFLDADKERQRARGRNVFSRTRSSAVAGAATAAKARAAAKRKIFMGYGLRIAAGPDSRYDRSRPDLGRP
jgi:hypothetical protein